MVLHEEMLLSLVRQMDSSLSWRRLASLGRRRYLSRLSHALPSLRTLSLEVRSITSKANLLLKLASSSWSLLEWPNGAEELPLVVLTAPLGLFA